MSRSTELRLFYATVGAVLLIPTVVGLVGAFGGLEGLAALFQEDRHAQLAPGLRNHLRAICLMFFMIAPLVVWTLRDLKARAGAFQIVLAAAWLAGFARLVGRFVDGNPGVIATVFCGLELGLMPVLLLWHARLVRRCGHESTVEARPSRDVS
jgi:hypothetical protein